MGKSNTLTSNLASKVQKPTYRSVGSAVTVLCCSAGPQKGLRRCAVDVCKYGFRGGGGACSVFDTGGARLQGVPSCLPAAKCLASASLGMRAQTIFPYALMQSTERA